MADTNSILDSIKKLHGISPEDTSFDGDMITHINSTLMILNDLGIGPSGGFFITDNSTEWYDYVPNKVIAEAIKSFVYIKVRLIFDPPASPTLIDALKSSAKEHEVRILRWAEENATYTYGGVQNGG